MRGLRSSKSHNRDRPKLYLTSLEHTVLYVNCHKLVGIISESYITFRFLSLANLIAAFVTTMIHIYYILLLLGCSMLFMALVYRYCIA